MGKAKRQAEKAARSALGVKPKASNKLARKAAARGAAETPRAAVTAASSPGAAAAQPSTIKARGAAPSRPSAVADLSGAAGRAAADRKAFRGKPLILCARGITHRFRHLMTDLQQLAPHHKTDSKLDTKHDWQAINEIAELKVRQRGQRSGCAQRLLIATPLPCSGRARPFWTRFGFFCSACTRLGRVSWLDLARGPMMHETYLLLSRSPCDDITSPRSLRHRAPLVTRRERLRRSLAHRFAPRGRPPA